ncbi:MAG TPA: hypothetical protein VGP72_13450 [Planctomycetota bacterium]
MRLTCHCLLALLCAVACAEEPAPAQRPARVTLIGGTQLQGLLSADRTLMLRPDGNGAPRKFEFSTIKKIAFGRRVDPNQENQALVALGDLQSPKFELREKALAQLRALGQAAVRPLRKASASPDAEVSSRAKELLAEMALPAGTADDQITLADGGSAAGELAQNSFVLRSRWGVFRLPLAALTSVELLQPGAIDEARLPAAAAPVDIVLKTNPAPASAAERWPPQDGRLPPPKALSGLTVLTIDNAPSGQQPGSPRRPVKAGERIEDAYAPLGVLLRAAPGVAIEAVETKLAGLSSGLGLQLKKSDLNVQFAIPGSFSRQDGSWRAGGVMIVGGAVDARAAEGTIGLAVYDADGRQLAEVLSHGMPGEEALPPGRNFAEYLGVRSAVPIARARFFRRGSGKEQDLIIDDVFFDRIAAVDHPVDQSGVWLASGEHLCGQITDASAEKGVSLRPAFLNEKTAAVPLSMDDIERFEPARPVAPVAPASVPADKDASTTDKKDKLLSLGTPHGVLLQNGESFRAFFLKLDDKEALFMLPGKTELRLPRQTLLKIDFAPETPESGELPPPVELGKDEKPGVDFTRRDQNRDRKEAAPGPPLPREEEGLGVRGQGAAEKKEAPNADPKAEPKKKPQGLDLQSTQELQPMPNVEIQAADMFEGELTVKDENGPWTFGIAQVKTLVFPKDPKAQNARPKFRAWILTLRNGSRFEVALIALTPEAVTADMAGGVVTLPYRVIDSLERKKK